ncbi:MAG TPA: carbohydrate ABC transporter permease, partial [Actinomycetota bacterium]|nr:carbohydrate ABC transporter permease [Actinomycetota bacterium]
MDVPAILSRRTGLEKRRLPRVLRQKIIPRFLLITMSLAFLTPLYWMVVTALKGPQELTTFPPTLLPLSPQWGNFVEAVNFFPFGKYLFNTVSITVFSVIGAMFSNLIIAYGFSRIEWPGRDAVFFFVIATIFIPFPVTMVPLFIIFAQLGWVNTF